ncbi:MAG: hypothetical protein WB678_11945 [Stellaceae bacterium]
MAMQRWSRAPGSGGSAGAQFPQQKASLMPDDAAQFRREEYNSLRAEILERIREANTLILTTAGGIGGAYAILVTNFAREPHLKFSHASFFVKFCFLLVIWTPVVFAVLASIKSLEISDIVRELAGYIHKIEELEYGEASPLPGWEHRMVEFRDRSGGFRRRWTSQPYTRIYKIMAAITFVIAAISTVYIAIVSLHRI